jgi:3-hydroxyisobutyrate dehydrogenase
MGRKAAEKILQAGYALFVFDASPVSLEKARTIGAETASSPMEISRRASTILMFLPGPKEVEDCVVGPKGLLNEGTEESIIVDLSTVDPGITSRMAEAGLARGVGYLDAPVLGRPTSVGKWALPVGGEREYLDKCRPVLHLLAEKIFHIGPSGSGNRVKLLNQMMFGAINAMTAEMMAIADRMGIPPGLLYETISASQAATVSNLFQELGRRISVEDYADPTFTVDLLEKDVRLAIRMAEESNARPILAGTVARINEKMQSEGFGRSDTSIMWKGYGKIWAETDKKSSE